MEARHEHEDLSRNAPTLHQLKGHDPFVVPGGFFERFPHQVQARITDPGRSTSSSHLIWRRLAWTLPVLVVLAIWWSWPEPSPSEAFPLANEQMITNDLDLYQFDEVELWAAYEVMDPDTMGPTTLELDQDEWLAYWEDAGALDFYLNTYEQ